MLEADQREAAKTGGEASDWAEIKARIPQSEPEVLKYLDSISLKNQPTDVLMQLAERLQERRINLFPDQEQVDLDKYDLEKNNDSSKVEPRLVTNK